MLSVVVQCDGGRPLCQTCRELGFACKYTETGSTANVIVGKEYLSELEQRLGMVEKSIRSINARMGDENTPPELPHHEPLRDSSESVDGADAMAALERQAKAPLGFVAASTGPQGGNIKPDESAAANPDAIDLDDDL